MLPAAAQLSASADTRARLLDAAAREIHVHGYQAASIARILQQTGLSKGALYYHFAGKQALGYAVFDERYAPGLQAAWIAPLETGPNHPVDLLLGLIEQVGGQLGEEALSLGCPVNNLAQEMSPVDEGFRRRVETLLSQWRGAISAAFQQAADAGSLRAGLDTEAAAALIVASLQGCLGMAKNAQSKTLFDTCGRGLVAYLHTLRRQTDQDPA